MVVAGEASQSMVSAPWSRLRNEGRMNEYHVAMGPALARPGVSTQPGCTLARVRCGHCLAQRSVRSTRARWVT